jgi:hypothetical protein
VASRTFTPGTHTIRLTNPDIFLNITVTVEVKENGNHSIPLPQLGVLTVSAVPMPNVVKVNGYSLDLTNDWPVLQRPAASGEIRVEFDWGDVKKEETIVLEPGDVEKRVTGIKTEAEDGR